MKLDNLTAQILIILLENLTKEQTGWRRFFSRWAISDEPLRNDAAYLLDRINKRNQ